MPVQVLVSMMEDEGQAPAQRINAAMAVALLVGHEEGTEDHDLLVLNTHLMQVGACGGLGVGGSRWVGGRGCVKKRKSKRGIQPVLMICPVTHVSVASKRAWKRWFTNPKP